MVTPFWNIRKNDENVMNNIPATISVKKRFIDMNDLVHKDGTKIQKIYLHDTQMN